MFDISWTELMVIAIVAIIFIGPKELPAALRTVGRWVGKARTMAREFQNNVDDMIRESELEELRKEVRKIESGELEREIEKAVDPEGDISRTLAAPDIPHLSAPPATSPESAPAASGEATPAIPPAAPAPKSG